MLKRYWWAWFLAVIAIAYFVIFVYPHYSRIRTTIPLSDADETMALVQAAWFQAVGSVLAIIAAFLIARNQASSAERAAEAEKRRLFKIAEGWLFSLVGGVCIDARAKGVISMYAFEGKLSMPLKPDRAAEIFRLKSIDALEGVLWTIQHYDESAGPKIAAGIVGIGSYNRTISDVVYGFGSSPNEAQSLKIMGEVAKRLHHAQKTAIDLLPLVSPTLAKRPEIPQEARDLNWFKQIKLPRAEGEHHIPSAKELRIKMSYQSEKFSQARRNLMLPHIPGESESIADAFKECEHALHRFDENTLEHDTPRNLIRRLRMFMDTTGVQDPSGERGLWALKADSFSTDERTEISTIIDELAHWFDQGLDNS